MLNETIENYLKAIYHLSAANTCIVNNKQLADKLHVIPATVTEAVKKLHDLKYVVYEKSYGTQLTTLGTKVALTIVRRHRIWETYLVNELNFGWDEVHEIAEELEHIKNDKLIRKLSEKLGHPNFDPHGDPIPDERGKIKKSNFIKLSESLVSKNYVIMGVTEHSSSFLKYLERNGLLIGKIIKVKSIEDFDNSITIICQKKEIVISSIASECLIIQDN